jgi:hypothetical protein
MITPTILVSPAVVEPGLAKFTIDTTGVDQVCWQLRKVLGTLAHGWTEAFISKNSTLHIHINMESGDQFIVVDDIRYPTISCTSYAISKPKRRRKLA